LYRLYQDYQAHGSFILISGIILSTKLNIPPVRKNAVERPLLIEALFSGVNLPGSFMFASGPAGFGKTSLLAEFVSWLKRLVAWVSLVEPFGIAVQ
jgi:LuxR family maltose regulon positive regulatory protein